MTQRDEETLFAVLPERHLAAAVAFTRSLSELVSFSSKNCSWQFSSVPESVPMYFQEHDWIKLNPDGFTDFEFANAGVVLSLLQLGVNTSRANSFRKRGFEFISNPKRQFSKISEKAKESLDPAAVFKKLYDFSVLIEFLAGDYTGISGQMRKNLDSKPKAFFLLGLSH